MKNKPKMTKNVGKGSREEELPSRFAKAELTGGDAFQRSMNNYSKKTPGHLNSNMPNIFMISMRGR